MNNKRLSKKIGIAAVLVFLIIMAAFQIFPFYIKLVQAVQPMDRNLIRDVVYYYPYSVNLKNFYYAAVKSDMFVGYKNSLIITFLSVSISLVIVVLCGYVFAKKKFRGKAFVFNLFLVTMMVPGELSMLSNYALISKLNLSSTYASVVLPGLLNVFGIFLVKQFMSTIPDSVLEAASIDGASEFVKIVRIIVPMSVTVISTFLILNIISSWNNYLWPLTVLGDEKMFTVQLKLMVFRGGTASSQDTILEAGATLIATIPVIIMYFIFNKKFIEGMSISGLK